MKTYSNLFGCSTYGVLDSASYRHTFLGLVECNDKLMETLKSGIEIKLSDVEKEILEVFQNNGVNLDNYTHCIRVGNDFYLTWE